jgi:membrane associated rhomboid family serine protease
MNWNDIKAFYLRGTSLMRLIYINVGAFVVVKLVSLCLVLFNINAASVTTYLEVPSNLMLLVRQPWSVITYMFLHADVMHIFFNMMTLYWFGRIILERISQKQLVALYVLGGLSGAALYLLAYNVFPYFATVVNSSYLLGASGAVVAVCVAAATLMPNYSIRLMLIGEVKLVWLAIGMVTISVFGITGNNAGGEFAHIGGAILGYLYAKAWLQGKDYSRPVTKVISWFTDLFKRSPKMKVNKGGKQTATRMKTDAEYNKEKRANEAAIDAILDKIKQRGYESLSAEEKRELFDRSKKN